MPILVGAHPGGRNSFAVSALFWTGRLPAMLIGSRAYSGVDAVLNDIMGTFGEWGELSAAAIDSPLTWSGSPNGWRECDRELKRYIPQWVPRTWHRSPNALPGAIGIQGPALTWSLAVEAKRGNIPVHTVVEAHSRISMARVMPEMRKSSLSYSRRDLTVATRRKHVARLVEHLVDSGALKIELEPPSSPEQLDALMCALTALSAHAPDSGLVSHTFEGGEIRPVGTRKLVILDALP